VNEDLAPTRRALVLGRMAGGFHQALPEADRGRRDHTGIRLQPALGQYWKPSEAPYFTSWVAQELPNVVNS